MKHPVLSPQYITLPLHHWQAHQRLGTGEVNPSPSRLYLSSSVTALKAIANLQFVHASQQQT